MKIVLIKEVKSVGKPGEIKEVADGFARNFLIPNGLAEPATEGAVKNAEQEAEERAEENQKELEIIQKNAAALDGRELFLKEKAKEGKLFGSVSAELIVEKLEEEGIELKKENIELENPIKETGEFPIKIKLKHGLEAEIKVIIEETS